EEFPGAAAQLLDDWGLPHYYVPAKYGGKLVSYPELVNLIRVLSRRDLSVAIGHVKTYLGCVCVWVGGSSEQSRRLADIVSHGGIVSLALTERDHGSDLQSTEVTALETVGGFCLSGEKWLINNATRGQALTVLAKSDPRGGIRGLSLFLVEKNRLPPATFDHLPKVRTHGIRGADISGIRFHEALLAPDALVGAQGAGLEITLKALQLTRTLCTGLSLGAADLALRTAVDFALERRLYGARVYDLPLAQTELALALVDLFIAEAVSLTVARAIHLLPERMSAWSAIAKSFVPTHLEATLARLAVVLGARHYLRSEERWSVFQKVLRDNALVSLFDGSTVVNLQSLALQLRALCRSRTTRNVQPKVLGGLWDLAGALPDVDPERLQLSAGGQDEIMQAVPYFLEQLRGVELDPVVGDRLQQLIERLVQALDQLNADVEALAKAIGPLALKSPEAFQLARRYCQLFAAATCVGVWFHLHPRSSALASGGPWLVLALERLLGLTDLEHRALRCKSLEAVGRELLRLHAEDRLFSLMPLQLARRRASEVLVD
ncbi:MAG: acyl-CoA dehydrogenase, partial [Cyanobacteria bacterium REEB65]|nr:acyl-CoA dehydrogenase [Cyanobacteria bacterium REEB65]